MNFYHEPHELAVRKPFLTFKFYEIRRIKRVFQQVSEKGSCGSWLFSSKPYVHAFVVVVFQKPTRYTVSDRKAAVTRLEYTFKTDTLFKMLFVKHTDLLKQLVSELLGIRLENIGEFSITNPEIPAQGDVSIRAKV